MSQLRQSSRRSACLAEYFSPSIRAARDPTVYFTGHAFPQTDLRTLQVGWSVIFRALAARQKLAAQNSNVSLTATATPEKLPSRCSTAAPSQSRSRFRSRASCSRNSINCADPLRKREALQNRLARLSAREGQYVVKILTGDLRIGLREGLVEEAIAQAFNAPLEEVKEANMLLGDIGRTAVLAKNNELHRAELSLFRPIKCMLASPEPTAEAIWKRFVDVAAAVSAAEPKNLTPETAPATTVAAVADPPNDAGYSICRRQIRWHPRTTASQPGARGNIFTRSQAYHRTIPRNRRAGAQIFRRGNSGWRDHRLRRGSQTHIFRFAETARAKNRSARSVCRRLRPTCR